MADRVSTEAKRDRDRRRRGFGCKRGRSAQGSDSCNATADEVTHERRQAIVLAAEPMVLNDSVLAFNVAGFTEAFRERCRMAIGAIERSTTDKADHRQLLRLLRARRERPSSRCAGEQRYELATGAHSITSSARSKSAVGNVTPIALARAALMISSNLVGCWTGKSPGLVPFKMRFT